ncbi:unnamed protein product, partial [Scytosiphon promiscuus]
MLISTATWKRSCDGVRRGLARARIARAMSSPTGQLGEEAGWEYDHDVLVVGGGIVGCTLACRLAQDLAPHTSASFANGATQPGGEESRGDGDGGARRQQRQQRRRRQRPAVGLIETRPPPSLASVMGRDGPDPRVYSLAPSSVKVLKEVGVWDDGVG